jgi:hypothetical protein
MLARLRELSLPPKRRLARDLAATYRAERRLGGQLRAHAARVPYPAFRTDLLRLADVADGNSATLANELRTLTGSADPLVAEPPRGGRNHWERVLIDLTDAEALHRSCADLARRWDIAFPSVADTFVRLARSAAHTGATLRTQTALADPHASD